MHFTESEAEILLHRLEASDAIADVLIDNIEDTVESGREDVIREIVVASCRWLVSMLKAGWIDKEDIKTEYVRFALADAVNGSTYIAAMYDENGNCDKRAMRRVERVAQSVERKVSLLTGEKCVIPRR